MTDTRIAYGVRCGWWGPIQEVSTKDGGVHRLPCCPVCGGMLFEVPDRAAWDELTATVESQGYTDYGKKMQWARDNNFHFYHLDALLEAYDRANP